MGDGGLEIAECFRSASEQPPITPESLAELDMPRIINNPKLRHDCNFDRELHFRPNLDGSKGKQKIKLAEDYWKALEGELFVYGIVHQRMRDPQQAGNDEYWYRILVASQKRLPQIFHTIRDILKTLVPDCDQKAILERLDVDLIMQEIMNGVCDLIDLGNWLAKVLKNHCAPMRDGMVDEMQVEIRRGASEDRPGRLVNGIRQLLNILEAMKLDVANHQIRHTRPLLVEDTVNFQRRYNAHRIAMNKIDVAKARLWIEDEMSVPLPDGRNLTHLEALTSGVLKSLTFYEHSSGYPQTFYLDVDRMRGLRLDIHSSAYHLVCRDVLIAMAGPKAIRDELIQAINALHITIAAIVGIHGRFMDRVSNIAAEIMRIVLLLEHRSPPFDSTLLGFVEQQLENDLHPGSSAFQKHCQDLYDRLLPKIQASVEQNAKAGAVHLQDKLVPAVTLSTQSQPFGFGAVLAPTPVVPPSDPDEELVRRFTHLIVLHWQVWADMAYLASDEAQTSFSPTEAAQIPHPSAATPTSSASHSPTIPVAQAVYAPGRKWLPIGVTVTEVPSGLPTPAASPGPDAQPAADEEQNDTSSSNRSRRSEPPEPKRQQPAA
jgi:hypothetical protein